MERLVEEKPKYKGKGKLTAAMRKKVTTAAQCAIKMRSDEKDTKRAVEFLRQDLRNGPLHCFGVYTNCSTDYCKVISSTPHTTSANDSDTTSINNDNTCILEQSDLQLSDQEVLAAIATQEEQFWEDAVNEEGIEAVRSVAPESSDIVDPELVYDIQRLVGQSIGKADKLIGKEKQHALVALTEI